MTFWKESLSFCPTFPIETNCLAMPKNDVLKGQDGNDLLSGGTGDDTIEGYNSNLGGQDNLLLVKEDRDNLFGGAGNDTLIGKNSPRQHRGGRKRQ